MKFQGRASNPALSFPAVFFHERAVFAAMHNDSARYLEFHGIFLSGHAG